MNDETTIIKLGGSLLSRPDLGDRLRTVLDHFAPPSPLIVPGGGPLADQIRYLDRLHHWPVEVSHELAMQTLSVTARIVATLDPRMEVVSSLSQAGISWERNRIPVLDPVGLSGELTLPAGWEVTSDSIAAWVAMQFPRHRLWLLKSVDLPDPLPTLSDAVLSGLIDSHFPNLAPRIQRLDWINLNSLSIQCRHWI
jgi:5-(aminomethyl)-3-furanmethanol phosphate kinase